MWENVDLARGVVCVEPHKTGARLEIPIHPTLEGHLSKLAGDAWRANIVDVERERPPFVQEHHWGLDQPELGAPLVVRVDEALEEISRRCAAGSVGEDQWLVDLSALAADDVSQIIIDACLRHGVTPDELLFEVSQCKFGH